MKKLFGYLFSITTFLFLFGCGKSTSIKPTAKASSVVQGLPQPTFIPEDTTTNTPAQYKFGVGGKVLKDSVAVSGAEIEVTFAVLGSANASYKTNSITDGSFSMDFNAVTTVDNTTAKICVRASNLQENCQNFTLQKGIRVTFPEIKMSALTSVNASSADVFGLSGIVKGTSSAVVGAEVSVSVPVTGSSTALNYVATSVADGKFTMEFGAAGINDGTIATVVVKASGYISASTTVTLLKGKNIQLGSVALTAGTNATKTWTFTGAVTIGLTTVIPFNVNSLVKVTFKNDASKNFTIPLAADGTYKKEVVAGAADSARVCFYPDAVLGLDIPNCVDKDLAANSDVQVPIGFSMGSIFYSCDQYASSDSVVYGQSIQVATHFKTSLLDASRYLVTLESKQADGTAAVSTATSDVLKYDWKFNVVGNAWVRYTIKDKQSNASIVCSEKTIKVTLPEAGLQARYYDFNYPSKIANLNPDTAPMANQGTIYSINFKDTAPNGLHRHDEWAMSIDGYIKIDVEGSYTFNKLSDDGIQVFLDDSSLMLHDGYYGDSVLPGTWFATNNLAHPSNNGVTRYLKPGLHKIRAKFMQGGGGYTFIMYWKKAGSTSFEVIPASAFYRSDK